MEKIDLRTIKPAAYNPRVLMDNAAETLKQSIRELGCIKPIIVNAENRTIIAGHQRTKTMLELGSDMGRAVTGGGLHGKDLSKADVSVNIMCHKLAQELGNEVTAFCAIGDEKVVFKIGKDGGKLVFPYDIIVQTAKEYINTLGGFERFAEWGLIR